MLMMESASVNSESKKQNRGWTVYLVFCNVATCFGSGFMFGYNVAVVNGPYAAMTEWLNATQKAEGKEFTPEELNTYWSIAVSLYLIGGALGSSVIPNMLAKKFGKRNSLLISSGIEFTGEVLVIIARYSKSYAPLFVGRAVVGLQGGIAISLSQALIVEHAPLELRGVAGSMYGLWVTIGLEVANLFGLPFVLGNFEKWQFLFIIAAGFYAMYGIGLCFVVESPRWLLDNQQEPASIKALMKLRKASAENDVKLEFESLKKIAQLESQQESVSLRQVFKDRRLWWPMILILILHVNNVFTGLLAVLIYATFVLSTAFNLSPTNAALANLGITFSTIIGNLICNALCERKGRRPLLIVGTLGIALTNVLLVIVDRFNVFEASIAAFAVFSLIFSMGPGPIPWFLPAEMFNQASRPLALAIGTSSNWIFNIIISFVFPQMQLHMGFYTFLPFAVISFVNFVIFVCFIPETSSRLTEYSPDIFLPGNSLFQYKFK